MTIIKRLFKILSIGVTILISWSCAKHVDEQVPIQTNAAEDFSSAIQLKVGNYWIYDGVSIDSLGNIKRWGRRDSVWIDRDSIVRDRIYYRRMGFHPRFEWLYDSAHCIVSLPDGTGLPRQVLFSGNNFKGHFIHNYP